MPLRAVRQHLPHHELVPLLHLVARGRVAAGQLPGEARPGHVHERAEVGARAGGLVLDGDVGGAQQVGLRLRGAGRARRCEREEGVERHRVRVASGEFPPPSPPVRSFYSTIANE